MDFSTLRITLRRFLIQFVSTFVISVINVNKYEGGIRYFREEERESGGKKSKIVKMATLMLSSRASTGGASASASAVAGSSRPPTPASVSEDKKSFGVYRVRQGDTLDVLARRYGVAVK